MEDTARISEQALKEAQEGRDKLVSGQAMPSVPISKLLRLCYAQHAEIQELRKELAEVRQIAERNRPDPRSAFIGG